jgi:hypothetical protein
MRIECWGAGANFGVLCLCFWGWISSVGSVPHQPRRGVELVSLDFFSGWNGIGKPQREHDLSQEVSLSSPSLWSLSFILWQSAVLHEGGKSRNFAPLLL